MDRHTSYLTVSACPHIVAEDSTRRIMGNVLLALLPTLIAATVIFGFRALAVTAVTTASCVLFEYLWNRLRGEQQTAGDLSAAVTGVLLAFNLPSTIPFYMAVIGAFVSIIVVKALFGGIGKNIANPAIVGRIVLAVSFTAQMTNYPYPTPVAACDAITSATPLAVESPVPLADLLLGTHGGVLGETCSVTLLLGLVWLLWTRTIEITIPAVYVGTVAVMSAIFGQDVLGQVFSGGLLLGAIFMATDYVTSPFTRKGKIVFALGLGILTCLIRFWSNMNEGVSYSILLMNLLVPYINRLTRNQPLGGGKQK